jgi:hypothetical protein
LLLLGDFNMKVLLVVAILLVFGAEAAKEKAIKVKDKDMMRKMIIYDKVKGKSVNRDRNAKLVCFCVEKSEHVLLPGSE